MLLSRWGSEVRVTSTDTAIRYRIGRFASVAVTLSTWRLHAADWTVRRAEDSA